MASTKEQGKTETSSPTDAFAVTAEQKVKITAYYAGKGLKGDALDNAVTAFIDCAEMLGMMFGPTALVEELRSVSAE